MSNIKQILKKANISTLAFIGVICVSVTIIVMASVIVPKLKGNPQEPQKRVSSSCPADYEEHPLIVVSLDGFHPDYLKYGLTPSLEELAKRGVSAPFMEPSYPTNTFPNHYSIVTGLYPESHGIIDSRFFDPDLNKSFSRKTNALREGHWWGGEPIWNTVQKQGKKSATFFWVGSEAPIGGSQPTYWKKYDYSITFNERIDEALKWVSLPATERPIWSAIYISEPDHSGHIFGPNSPEVKEQLKHVDAAIKGLMDGIEAMNLTHCINIMVISDHGMVHAGVKGLLPLENLMGDVAEVFEFSPKSYERFNIKINDEDTLKRVHDAFSCSEDFKLYHKKDIPNRLHFSNNNRIHDFVFLYKEGITPTINSTEVRMGEHGYDNTLESMKSLFIASGPDFKTGKTIEPFKNIELYNIMCHLVGVKPAPNNGTEGALFDGLTNPPIIPSMHKNKESEMLPFPSDEEVSHRLKESSCQTDVASQKDVINHLKTETLDNLYSEMNCAPWGLPTESNKQPLSIKALPHPDHVTGYSMNLRIPMWTSFSFKKELSESYNYGQNWVTDVRIPTEAAPNCTERDVSSIDKHSFALSPLFIPEFCKNSTFQPFTSLISNAVPISSYLGTKWKYFLTEFMVTWLVTDGPMNAVIGPVIDQDSDSLSDQMDLSDDYNTVTPSDMFAIVIWCRQRVDQVHTCQESELDVLSFIFPQYLKFETCFTNEEFVRNFMATLSDVEKVTGLDFFPKLEESTKLKLGLRLPTLLRKFTN